MIHRSSRHAVHPAALVAAALLLAACAPKPGERVPSIAELAADPIALSGAIDKCNRDTSRVRSEECVNARAALKRREGEADAARATAAQAEFERAREALRQREDRKETASDTSKPPDAYQLPLEPQR